MKLKYADWMFVKLALAVVVMLTAGTAQALDNTGTGGTITYTDAGGLNPVASPPYIGGYVVHTFTNSGTLTIPIPASANVLVVAGGGGGGLNGGGGGGAGGLIYSNAFPVVGGSNYTVTVGGGGAGSTSGSVAGSSGTNSVFGTLTAVGGGGGGSRDGGKAGLNGGSGGGGGAADSGAGTKGTGTTGQGYDGGVGVGNGTISSAAGGGGGAGGVGSNGALNLGGNGGNGMAYSISGASVTYAGGGGGGTTGAGSGSTGGIGGGGNGVITGTAGSGGTNTGGGGGGGGGGVSSGGNGGSGIVIVRYPYEVGSLSVSVTAPANGQQILPGSSVTATVSVMSGTMPYTVTFYTNSAVAWSTNNASTNLFSIDLGVLANGTYTNYATVTDSADPVATAFSATNTFTVAPDTTAPTPATMTFAVNPAARDASTVVMTATTATDALSPPVEYYFENVTNSSNSGWISGTAWTNSGLTEGVSYGYQVKARDSATPPNETAFSSVFNVIPAPPTILWDSNTTGANQTDGAGTWLNANQWWTGTANATWDNGLPNNATIGNGGTGGTITLGAVTAGTVTLGGFNGTYTLTGGTLTQSGGLTVSSGNVTIDSLISGAGGISKAGTGQLKLSGANTFSGQLTIANGTFYNDSGINNKNADGVFGNSSLPIILGASGQTGRLAIQIDGGPSTTKDFTLAAGGTGEIQFGNGNWGVPFQITNADRNLTLSGVIGGSGNFVKLGWAAVVLSGNNNYSGTTTVNEGPLRLSSATALPGGIGATGGASALTINGNGATTQGAVVELTAASGNFLRALGTGVDQFQIPGGISGFDANGSARQVIVGNNPAFELQWGIPTFNPSALLLGYHSVTATGALTLQNKIDLNGATRTITVNANTATLSGDIRTSSGTAGITKTGAGTLELSGANTYNGPTTISAGTLTLSNVGTFNNTSQIVLSGTSSLIVNAANASLAKLATGGGVPFGTFLRYSQAQTAAGAANGPGTIRGTVEINLTNVNPDYTLNFGSDSTFKNLVVATYTSPITLSGNASIDSSTAVFTLNTGGITASTAGTKTLSLTGGNTGANTISSVIGNGSGTIAMTKSGGGSWTLTGANTYSGATTVSAGTLILSGVTAIGSSPVTIAGGTLTISNTGAFNNGDRLSGSLAFTMNSGTFNFNNDASAGNSFSESVGTLTLIGGANTVGITQAIAGQTSTLTFDSLSRTAGAINFSGAGLGAAVDPRSKITFTSAPTLTDGIIGPWATVNGNSYATLIGNDVVAYGGVMTDVNRGTGGTKAIPDGAGTDVRIIEAGAAVNITLGAATTTVRSILNSTSGGTAAAATIAIGAGEILRVNSINTVPTLPALTLGTAVGTGTLTPATAGGNLLMINNSANFMTVNSVIADNTSASTVTKDGSGVLKISAINTYSGGTILNAGTLWVDNSDLHLGAAGSSITFNGSAALSFGNRANGGQTFNLGTRSITINNGAVAGLYFNEANKTITVSGAITGTGGIIWGKDPILTYSGGSGAENLNLLSQGNNFTGPITFGLNTENIGVASTITVNSLVNSTSPITFNLGGGGWNFNLGSSATQNLSLPSRPVDWLNSNVTINNQNSTYTMTLGAVSTSTAGAKTLNLGAGGAGGIIAGAITDGVGQISVSKTLAGTWSLSGTNTYSGATTLNNDCGQLTILGKAAVSPYTTIAGGRSTTLSLRMDDAGIVNLGNTVQPFGFDTSTGVNNYLTIDVRNNGGATTGSTLVLGKLDFVSNPGNNSCGHGIKTTGANGYRLQFGDVDLSYAILGGVAGGPQRFEPQTAPMTIAGTIRQVSGNTGGSTTDNNLYLGGIASGNLISGSIQDAADYPSNPNATPLNLYKGEASTWTLSGINTHSGSNTVTAGTLVIDGGDKSQCLSDTNLLAIAGGKVQLNTGVREKVGSLKLGAGAVLTGPTTYGSTTSSAANKTNTYFAGAGVLYVGLDIPAGGTVIMFR